MEPSVNINIPVLNPHAAPQGPNSPLGHPLQYFENVHRSASSALKEHVERALELEEIRRKQELRDQEEFELEMAEPGRAQEPNHETAAEHPNPNPRLAAGGTTTPLPNPAHAENRPLPPLTIYDLFILWKWVSGMKAALSESLRLHYETWATARCFYLCECSAPSKGENCFSQRRMVQRLGVVNALLMSVANAMAAWNGDGGDREYCLSAVVQAQTIAEFLEQL